MGNSAVSNADVAAIQGHLSDARDYLQKIFQIGGVDFLQEREFGDE